MTTTATKKKKKKKTGPNGALYEETEYKRLKEPVFLPPHILSQAFLCPVSRAQVSTSSTGFHPLHMSPIPWLR
jgi:hypothetical protein